MLGEVDATDFILAEKLGMTLGEVSEMPNREFVAWRSWLTYRAAMDDLASRVAARGRR